jgi:hypothetical protein
MPAITLTDELKQMNAYWRLLAGLINEGLGIVNDERHSPEVRLERLWERLEFARQFTQHLPPSVRAELDADPAVQAVLADIPAGRDSVTGAHCLSDDELQQLRPDDDGE